MSHAEYPNRHLSMRTMMGSYSLQEGSPEIFAHGAFTVTIGSQRFDCMRVFDIDTPSESGVMVEAYVTRTGVTVLARRYNGNLWSKESGRSNALGSEPTWAKETPDAETRIFNGVGVCSLLRLSKRHLVRIRG